MGFIHFINNIFGKNEESEFDVLEDKFSKEKPRFEKKDFEIVNDILLSEIDDETLKIAKDQRNKMGNKHLYTVLHERGDIPYSQIAKMLYNGFGKYLEKEKDLYFTLDVKEIFYDASGHILLKRNDGNIRVAYTHTPSVEKEFEIPQLVVPYDVYLMIESKVKYYKNKNKKNKTGNKDDKSDDNVDMDIENLPFRFKDIVEYGIEKKASDIHISYSDNAYYVALRRDNYLINEPNFLLSKKDGHLLLRDIRLSAITHTKGKFNPDDFNYPHDARIVYNDLGADCRLALISDGLMNKDNAVTVRILLKQIIDKTNFDFRSLGYLQDFIDDLLDVQRLEGGLMFVSGITGSGKSTLLSYFVSTFDPRKRIFTIEDPIEYVIPYPNVTQVQVYIPKDSKRKVGALEYVKIFKRADPNVIIPGEIRNDKELVEALVESAQAGQFVGSTVHIRSAFEIYHAINSSFGMKTKDAISLIFFSVNQTLVKKLCPHCKKKDDAHENHKKLHHLYKKKLHKYAYDKPLEEFLEDMPETYVANPDGCEVCRVESSSPGYLGRIPVYEWFRPNVAMKDWLFKDERSSSDIERFVYSENLGRNKLDVYLEMVRLGLTDASDDVLDKIR